MDEINKALTGSSKHNPVDCQHCQMSAICSPLSIEGLSLDLVDTILQPKQPLERGEYLFRSGQPIENLYALCSGTVKLTTHDADDTERVVGLQLPGELIGASALVAGQYPYNAQALEDVLFCAIPYSRLKGMAEQVPAVSARVIELMSEEMLHQQQLLLWLTGRRNAGERLAAFLWGLTRRLSRRGFPGQKFSLGMSRGEIASYLGLASETVSRLLSRFQSENLVKVSGARIWILDGESLRLVAGIDPP